MVDCSFDECHHPRGYWPRDGIPDGEQQSGHDHISGFCAPCATLFAVRALHTLPPAGARRAELQGGVLEGGTHEHSRRFGDSPQCAVSQVVDPPSERTEGYQYGTDDEPECDRPEHDDRVGPAAVLASRERYGSSHLVAVHDTSLKLDDQ